MIFMPCDVKKVVLHISIGVLYSANVCLYPCQETYEFCDAMLFLIEIAACILLTAMLVKCVDISMFVNCVIIIFFSNDLLVVKIVCINHLLVVTYVCLRISSHGF